MRKTLLVILFLLSSQAWAWQAYDATGFGPHPYMGKPISVVYEDALLGGHGDHTNMPPVESTVKGAVARYVGKPIVVLDIEAWKVLTSAEKLDTNAARNAGWYLQVIRWAKEALPGTKVGFFDLPHNARFVYFWPALHVDAFRRWQALMAPVMTASDAFFPDFYARWHGPEVSQGQIATVALGKIYGKPVYPFFWHRDPATMGYLSDAEISSACQWMRLGADGVVWWSIKGERFDPTSTWVSAADKCFN